MNSTEVHKFTRRGSCGPAVTLPAWANVNKLKPAFILIVLNGAFNVSTCLFTAFQTLRTTTFSEKRQILAACVCGWKHLWSTEAEFKGTWLKVESQRGRKQWKHAGLYCHSLLIYSFGPCECFKISKIFNKMLSQHHFIEQNRGSWWCSLHVHTTEPSDTKCDAYKNVQVTSYEVSGIPGFCYCQIDSKNIFAAAANLI